MIFRKLRILVLILVSRQLHGSEGFIQSTTAMISKRHSRYATMHATRLEAIKRAGLEDIDADSLKSPRIKKANKKQQKVSVSPALAEWASNGDKNSNEKDRSTTSAGDAFNDDGNIKKGYGSSSRRTKQAARQAVDVERDSNIQTLLDQLQETLATKKPSINDILQPIQGLLQLSTPNTSANLRSLVASPKTLNFRLAWVGSDDSVSHVGTGLHKVALARLQEVFLSLSRSRVTWTEVIRIVGPFPNVKNELQGDCKVSAANKNTKRSVGDDESSIVADWSIGWDSMVDGTGRQITAGPEVRNVDLQVALADPAVIVAVVPAEDGLSRQDILEDGGKHVLLFVREDKLDDKLEAFRVA